jgi:polar amino acid transport system permease protein
MLSKPTHKTNKIIASIMFFCLIGAFYFITKKFDYTWSWEKVPEYFISHKVETLKAPFEGSIAKSGPSTYKLSAEGKEDFSFEASESELVTFEGAKVYEGDELSQTKSVEVGALLQGLWMTAKLSFWASILSLFIGLISGLSRLSKNPIFNWPATVYIELIRGTPLLVQLFIIYFMVGTVVGIDSRFFCGVLALGLFGGAYSGEIIRAGIESIDRGQMEAARSLGLNQFQAMLHIIFPQMFRRSLAALGGTYISLIKDSSLVSVMALTDLTKAGREIVSSSFMVFEIWLVVAALYFLITIVASLLIRQWEIRLSRGEK